MTDFLSRADKISNMIEMIKDDPSLITPDITSKLESILADLELYQKDLESKSQELDDMLKDKQ